MAAGHPPPTPKQNFGGLYVNTTHAKVGDKGSEVLPPAPSGTVWSPGSSYEVSWVIEANHGGEAGRRHLFAFNFHCLSSCFSHT